MWYRFVRWFLKNLYFRFTGGFEGLGAENIPAEGPIIVAPTHLSYLDPPAVAVGKKRELTFMAKEELFGVPVLGWMIRSVGSFPVRRGGSDTESIRQALAILEAGRSLLVFPEGTRGNGEVLGDLNPGVAMLAKRTDAWVIPIAICGTHMLMPRKPKKGLPTRLA